MKLMKTQLLLALLLVVGCTSTPIDKGPQSARDIANAGYPLFDRGPDLNDEMQAELVDIINDMPYLPGISEKLQVLAPSYKRGQKMRPDFGAMPIRGFAIPNSVSVLVIGQDATHIAEGANRPGIAGFGGRVHDMLKHMGVIEGVIFTNLYVNTISGQYGSRNTPVLVNDKEVAYTNVIENRLWLMTHSGAYAKWRNRFLSWVIRNNKDSLKMVMLLGQAGKDAGSSFVNSIGGKVGARSNVGDGSKYKLPQFVMVGAGGNNEWATPVTKDGKDVAEVMRQLPEVKKAIEVALENFKTKSQTAKVKTKIKTYEQVLKNIGKKINYKNEIGQTTAKVIFAENPEIAKEYFVFSESGPKGNGVLYPEQFGGWDIRSMTVNGKKTRSISGLKISCYGSQVAECQTKSEIDAPNIVFVGSPHPTSLSMNSATAAGKVEKELLSPLRKEMEKGWEAPTPEAGLKSAFLEGKPYKYGRGIIPPSHGDPGITDLRLLPVSTAKRAGKSTIVIGTRGNANFSKSKLKTMEKATPSNTNLIKSNTVLTGRPRMEGLVKKYDRGPERKMANLIFKGLDKQKVLWVKSEYDAEAKKAKAAALKRLNKSKKGLTKAEKSEESYLKAMNKIFDKYGIDAFNFKSHPAAGFFGHYRGTFDSPKVIILADPVGYDSFITSKAATGNRGQYLNGLMKDLKVGADYLVISTVPMPMDGATPKEWQAVLETTKDYRTNIFKELETGSAILIADGAYAAQELERIAKGKKVIKIVQTVNPSKDMIKGAKELKIKASGKRIDIPREHLTWIARVWEGTSGDRVITAEEKENRGKAFAIVAPNWARKNTVYFNESTKQELRDSWDILAEAGDPMPGESLKSFVRRRTNCASKSEWKKKFKNERAKAKCISTVKNIEFKDEK